MKYGTALAHVDDHHAAGDAGPSPGKSPRTASLSSTAPRELAGETAGEAGAERLPFLDMMLQAEGRPLPSPLRQRMEDGFGADFGDVRVHADSAATAGVGARAMTTGDHLGFAPGEWSPDSAGGQELLAHELAHVVQQRQGRATSAQRKGGPVVAPSLEAEADDAAARVMRGEPAGLGAAPSTGACAPACQPKLNDLRSILFSDVNPVTALSAEQDRAVKRFVGSIEESLGTWRGQRGTRDLAFKRDVEIQVAFDALNEVTMDDPASRRTSGWPRGARSTRRSRSATRTRSSPV